MVNFSSSHQQQHQPQTTATATKTRPSRQIKYEKKSQPAKWEEVSCPKRHICELKTLHDHNTPAVLDNVPCSIAGICTFLGIYLYFSGPQTENMYIRNKARTALWISSNSMIFSYIQWGTHTWKCILRFQEHQQHHAMPCRAADVVFILVHRPPPRHVIFYFIWFRNKLKIHPYDKNESTKAKEAYSLYTNTFERAMVIQHMYCMAWAISV